MKLRRDGKPDSMRSGAIGNSLQPLSVWRRLIPIRPLPLPKFWLHLSPGFRFPHGAMEEIAGGLFTALALQERQQALAASAAAEKSLTPDEGTRYIKIWAEIDKIKKEKQEQR